jgi:hypothetical protein
MIKGCECSDIACPAHKGIEDCPEYGEVGLYYRPDWGPEGDYAYFCEPCGEDACNAGQWGPAEEEEAL